VNAVAHKVIFGVDFGSKLSGTTVVALFERGKIFFLPVDEDVDADDFILKAAAHFKPEIIFLDAPLSLPGKYCGLPGFDNYHFRRADLELRAMSPMFLGGLTARAMALKDTLRKSDIRVYETYPKVMAERFGLRDLGYKNGRSALIQCRSRMMDVISPTWMIDCQDITTWHHLDALLALLSALNLETANAHIYGDEREGLIYI
jgi:predicted nuclease with RNAse H fold